MNTETLSINIIASVQISTTGISMKLPVLMQYMYVYSAQKFRKFMLNL